jgi:hypothetical protein
MRGRAALLAAGCALASLDARADPYAQAFEMWFLAVGGGCLACIVVELAAGKTRWTARLAIGVGFAVLNIFLYVVFLNILIQAAIALGPAESSSGSGPFILLMLAAWVLPAMRLWWLLRRRPPARP